MSHRVALVDDEAASRLLTRLMLERKDCTVAAEFADLPSAIAALEAGELDEVDAIVVDHYLGDDRGLTLAAFVRERTPDIPIVLLTAMIDPAVETDAANMDVVVLDKLQTIDLAEVLHTIWETGGTGAPVQV